MSVFSLSKMDGLRMESYLSYPSSLRRLSPFLCMCLSLSLSGYCPTLQKAQNEQFPVYRFLLTPSSCVLTFSDHRPASPSFTFVLRRQSNAQADWNLRGQVLTSCCVQTTIAASGRQMWTETESDREALALPGRHVDRSCELSLTWELAFVNT